MKPRLPGPAVTELDNENHAYGTVPPLLECEWLGAGGAGSSMGRAEAMLRVESTGPLHQINPSSFQIPDVIF